MLIRKVNMIDSGDWDDFVCETYGRPYCFQQQDDCKQRGIHKFSVPDASNDENMNDEIPEIVNDSQMGVKFAKWLERDPKQSFMQKNYKGVESLADNFSLGLWWERNFYPDFQTVANDLFSKGLLEAGDYIINIDW